MYIKKFYESTVRQLRELDIIICCMLSSQSTDPMTNLGEKTPAENASTARCAFVSAFSVRPQAESIRSRVRKGGMKSGERDSMDREEGMSTPSLDQFWVFGDVRG